MCKLVFADDRIIETVSELRDLLGAANIVATTKRRPLSPDECLCWVNIEMSAKKAGWDVEWDPCGFRLRRLH